MWIDSKAPSSQMNVKVKDVHVQYSFKRSDTRCVRLDYQLRSITSVSMICHWKVIKLILREIDDDISSLRQYLWYVEAKNIAHMIGRETIAGDVSSIQVGLFYMYEWFVCSVTLWSNEMQSYCWRCLVLVMKLLTRLEWDKHHDRYGSYWWDSYHMSNVWNIQREVDYGTSPNHLVFIIWV